MKYKTEMQCNDEIQTEIQNKSHSFIRAHIYVSSYMLWEYFYYSLLTEDSTH